MSDYERPDIIIRRGPDYLGFLLAAFLFACVSVGFGTIIVYSIGLVNGWRVIVCGS